MGPLEPPFNFYVAAAEGWLGLGNRREAEAELAQIPPVLAGHPAVLEVRWLLAAGANDWEAGVAIADQTLAAAPDSVNGWLHRSYALRRTPAGGLRQAWDALLPAWKRFPTEPIVAYNLACYACQMNRLPAAREWLRRAMLVGGEDNLKGMALRDPDLEPMWGEIAVM